MKADSKKSAPAIKADRISLIRGNSALLDDITLAVPAAKTTVIMGHNGAGKTILLSALHGLVTITEGTISYAANCTQKMVFQKPILLRRSAKAHFIFASGISDPMIIHSWFQQAGMEDKMPLQARHLSSGEAQKLALISALATQPDILFLDEPTANLDAESRSDVEALIMKAKQSGTSIILITHALAQAKRLADHMIFMQKGRIYDDSSAAHFFAGARSSEAEAFLSELSGLADVSAP